ncbi:MAG: hypothetical protein FWF08_00655 [Oscillospiraceae bacterium]|nr:hypothetical protein [Oscillospiraceae bacterium]
MDSTKKETDDSNGELYNHTSFETNSAENEFVVSDENLLSSLSQKSTNSFDFLKTENVSSYFFQESTVLSDFAEPENALPGEEAFKPPDTFNNAAPYKELITKKYKEDDLVAEYINVSFSSSLISNFITSEMINDSYPLECLRKLDNGNAYAVYQTEEGGNFYMFFTPFAEPFENSYSYKCSVYSKDVKEYKDFKDIKKKDSISKVENIDPTVSSIKRINKNLAKKYGEEDYDEYINVKLLLKDGVLLIVFVKKGNDYIIYEMHHFEDFKWDITEIIGFVEDVYPIDCTIFPQDYPE